MQRLFTKDATGVAPDGRWYAGDVNALQDAVAAASDFTQTVDVSTLRVGSTDLLIVKYGTGELRVSGALRTDGILRALGGLYAGAFTTTQRDAIASGSRPYGLVILNTTTNEYEWNKGSDATPDWQPFGAQGDGIGNLSARPAANAVQSGTHYFATDQVAEYVSDGSSWYRTGLPAGFVGGWYKPDAAVPSGWVLYDGGTLPGSTGIYADLYAHLGNTTTKPDTRGRMEVGLGSHADVNAVGNNDGVTVANRRPKHRHTPHTHAGNYSKSGGIDAAGSTGTFTQGTIPTADGGSGNANDPLDAPAYIVACRIAKL